MKRTILVFCAVVSIGPLWAQQSATVKEPAEQCYSDLKANLPEAIRWDDAQMMVISGPLLTSASGNVQMYARVFQEKKDTECKIVVGIDSPSNSVGLNAMNSDWLWRNAHLFAARVDSVRKAREKAESNK